MARRKAADPHANRLLGLLPPRDYERLRPHLQRISLEYRQSLYRANKPIGFVYFIETGVGSLVSGCSSLMAIPRRKSSACPKDNPRTLSSSPGEEYGKPLTRRR